MKRSGCKAHRRAMDIKGERMDPKKRYGVRVIFVKACGPNHLKGQKIGWVALGHTVTRGGHLLTFLKNLVFRMKRALQIRCLI